MSLFKYLLMNGVQIGNYIVEKKIASGSFSSVYLAKHIDTGIRVCMKVILKEKTPTVFVESEVSFMRTFQHPFIISLYQYFQDQTRFFIIMEFVEGPTLLEYINDSTETIPAWKVKHFVGEMLQAIYYLHNVVKIAHRDIKLENIILDQNGNIRFIDFGLSKEAEGETAMKTACGSAMYIAPEILQCKQYTNATDMWSLGCCIYSLACGSAPFYDPNAERQNRKIQFSEPEFPSNLDPNLVDLIQGLLRKDPQQRLTARQALMHRYFFDYKNPNILGENFYLAFSWENHLKKIEANQQVQDFLKRLKLNFSEIAEKIKNTEFDDETAILRILSTYTMDPEVSAYFAHAKDLSTSSKKMMKTLTCPHMLFSPPNPKSVLGLIGKTSHTALEKKKLPTNTQRGRRKVTVKGKVKISTFG